MSKVTIYHNPSCSKSRQTLALLQDNNIEAEIIQYLENPPSAEDLKHLIKLLGLTARDIIRSGEQEYADQNLGEESLSEESLIQAIIQTPKLLQRPIVVANDKAIIGRPPENVLKII